MRHRPPALITLLKFSIDRIIPAPYSVSRKPGRIEGTGAHAISIQGARRAIAAIQI